MGGTQPLGRSRSGDGSGVTTIQTPDGPVRIDAMGNPMVQTSCPMCGKGEEMTGLEFAGRQNAAASGMGRAPDGPCSRPCELQLEYAQTLAGHWRSGTRLTVGAGA